MVTNNLVINVGEDFYAKLLIRHGINKSPRNLTGAEVFGEVKSSYTDIEPVFQFDVEYVDRAGGIVAIKASRPVVARLQQNAKTEKQAVYYYDVCLKASDKTERILGGTLTAIFNSAQ